MCVCVFMCLCLCVCLHVYVYVYMCVCESMYICMHVSVCVYAYICVCLCVCAYLYIGMCAPSHHLPSDCLPTHHPLISSLFHPPGGVSYIDLYFDHPVPLTPVLGTLGSRHLRLFPSALQLPLGPAPTPHRHTQQRPRPAKKPLSSSASLCLQRPTSCGPTVRVMCV